MLRYPGATDVLHVAILEPRVTRCFWSARRALHGAQVHLHVETRFVPDATPLLIQIWEEGADLVRELPLQAGLKNGKLTLEHRIDGSEDATYFLVTIPRFDLVARSPLLLVDRDPPADLALSSRPPLGRVGERSGEHSGERVVGRPARPQTSEHRPRPRPRAQPKKSK